MTNEGLLAKARRVLSKEGLIGFLRRAFYYVLNLVGLKILANIYVRGFHCLYYYSHVWWRTYWLGVPAQKPPTDLWIYQEIISETRPDFIIETGTASGGSALFTRLSAT